MDRRSVMTGGLAGAISANAAARASERYGVVEPRTETWSESLMLLHFDPQVGNGISVRVSRYPQMNAAWVWCHVLFDGRMYAFTERRLPCAPDRNLGSAPVGDYDSAPAGVAFTRDGPVDHLRSVRLKARVKSRQSSEGRDGAGDIPVAIDAVFRPEHLKENLPPGRSEWTGQAKIDLRVGGRRVALSGIAKAHEQTQTMPRFDEPFTYAMLWNPTASFIATAAVRRRYGDFEADGASRPVKDFRPAAPAGDRRFAATLDDGRQLAGRATRIARYDVPVFDRMWNGNIVRAELAGQNLVGMLNDWRPEDQRFG